MYYSVHRNRSNLTHSHSYVSKDTKTYSGNKHRTKRKQQRESLNIGGVVVATFALGGGAGSAIIMSQM